MLNVEKICNKISNNIATELKFDEEKKSVINYGMFAVIQMVIAIGLTIIFGFVFHVLVEALIVSFVISILRKSSGGAHARTPGRCAVLGTVVSVGFGLLSKFVDKSLIAIMLTGIIIFLWSFYIVYKLAPVDSAAKPIKKQERRKKLKRSSIIILSVYLILVIVNIIYYYYTSNISVLTYTICIYMGLVWQIFSLTKSGHLILGKIDAVFK
ncbi:accessory gene regulator ArgB-like protein [Clostridium cadaveris]|uniref:accessory gene regulator ArgB-like protein n=1 Tax=Clostridium cadaveris TaxID=1529 RepID=UPI0015B55069|nr:accessory gene regulator B family protein [Clostridium cadaveris]NWK10647.1 accessory gene regulator B family protein [Clostridium cadaveris]